MEQPRNLDQNLTIYKASAGSGKTYNLALEYIKLVLGVKDPETGRYTLNSDKYQGKRLPRRHRHVLAITFTNKATEEMKDRIIAEFDALSRLPQPGPDGSMPKDANYAAALTALFGCSRSELADASRLALNDLLFDYSTFNVSTIDSFFQTVLRTFAREVDHQGDFEVEMNDSAVINSSVGLMLHDLNYGNSGQRLYNGENPEHFSRRIDNFEKWLEKFMMRKISDGEKFDFFNRNSKLFSELTGFIKAACTEDFKRQADRITAYLDDPKRLYSYVEALKSAIDDIATAVSKPARAALAAYQAEGFISEQLKPVLLALLTALSKGKLPAKASWEKVTIRYIIDRDKDKYEKLFNVGKLPVIGKGKSKTKVFPSDNVIELIETAVDTGYRSMARKPILNALLEACDNLQFMGFALRYMEQFRVENNLILLSDTNNLIRRIIGHDETPFIYERMGVELEHFLIDEFQDTSKMQWENLHPLVAQSLMGRHDNLIIGDEKQAIYRFRQSDASMLRETVANVDFPTQSYLRGTRPGENTNYRSAPDVVRFNNLLFRRLAATLGMPGYDHVVQQLPNYHSEQPAYITIRNLKKNEAMAQLAADIKRQHDAGYRWSDIAVLVRSGSALNDIVTYLIQNHPDIKVLSDEALLLRNASAVQLIIAILRLMANRDQSEAKRGKGEITAVLTRYNFCLAQGMTPVEALNRAVADQHGDMAAETIADILNAGVSSLAGIVEIIVDRFIPKELQLKQQAFISAFEDAVLDFSSSYTPTIQDFLKWWDNVSDSLALGSNADADAVRVMTIHKSKGLEWDCVHLPVASWKIAQDGKLWIDPAMPDFDPEITPPLLQVNTNAYFGEEGQPFVDAYNADRFEQTLDTLNLTYVAMTRAARELSICTDGTYVGKLILEALAAQPTEAEIAECGNLIPASLPWVDHAADDSKPEDLLFELGKPTAPDPAKEDKRRNEEAKRIILPTPEFKIYDRKDTRELICIEQIAPVTADTAALDDSGPTVESIVGEAPENETAEEARQRELAAQRGIFLHAVMAEMEQPDDLDRAYALIASRMHLPGDDRESYLLELRKAISCNDPRLDGWYDPMAEVYREQSILLNRTPEVSADGFRIAEEPEIQRPDRIVVHQDGSAEVVDFKFTADSNQPKHLKQIRRYAQYLQMMGYSPVSGHLWYPLLNEIKSVTI